jgi:hypothetical protein
MKSSDREVVKLGKNKKEGKIKYWIIFTKWNGTMNGMWIIRSISKTMNWEL